MMPNGWRKVTLKEIVKFQQGVQVPVEEQMPEQLESTVRFLRISDYTKTNEPPRYIELQDRLNLVSDDDVVMVRYGEAGRVVRGYRGAIANNLFSISPVSKNDICKQFLFYMLSSAKIQESIASFNSSSTMPQVSHKALYALETSLPPKNEQEKIAKILSTWDEAIEKLEKILSIKNTEFTWYIDEAIAKSQNAPLMAIEDIFEVGRGRVISKGEIQKNFGEYPVYSSQTSNDGIFGHLNSYDFEGEYLTWTTDGANAGAVFYRNGKFNCTNVCGTLKQKHRDINLLFISYLLRNITPKHVSKNLANPKLMNGVMKAIKIHVPSIDFQKATAKLFQSKKQEIDLFTKKIDFLKLQKQGLMQQLLTGKKRVKV